MQVLNIPRPPLAVPRGLTNRSMVPHSGKLLQIFAVSAIARALHAGADMTQELLAGSKEVMKKLEAIAQKMGGGHVDVGFMEGATYPDGTPVAAVAFWDEFGVPSREQPPRPFFRSMISNESESWPEFLAKQAQSNDYDGQKSLGIMGEHIKGQLQKSINDFTTPGIKPSTAKAKGFDKPLIDSSDMLNSVAVKVSE